MTLMVSHAPIKVLDDFLLPVCEAEDCTYLVPAELKARALREGAVIWTGEKEEIV